MRKRIIGFVIGILVSFSANAQTTAKVTITITPPPPPTVTAFACAPTSNSVPSTTPAGFTLSSCTVTMSDGSNYPGHLIACLTALVNGSCTDVNSPFVMSGLNLVTARTLTSSDVTPTGTPDVVTVSRSQ